MVKLEREIEKKLREMVEKHGGLCLKWVCPGWSGVPDRIVLMPGGRVHFVETKRPKGGRVSAMQSWWHAKLSRLGFSVWCVHDENQIRIFELSLLSEREGLTR